MKIKQMLKWNWQCNWLAIVSIFGVLLILNAFTSVMTVLGEHKVGFGGNGICAVTVGLILGIMAFGTPLRFSGANGVSRKAVFLSMPLCMVTFCAALAAVDCICFLIFNVGSLGTRELASFDFIQMLFPQDNPLMAVLTRLALNIGIGAALWMFGYLIGGAFYRLGKLGKIFVAAGVPIALFVLLPTAVGLLPEGVLKALADNLVQPLGNFLMRSPYHMAGVGLLAAVVMLPFGWLLIRRAPVNPVALS